MPAKPLRPFYHEFAWAYDLIIEDDPHRKCDFIAGQLELNGVVKGARILDAGCGTGRYSISLAEHGYRVLGLDISEDLLDVARSKQLRLPTGIDLEFRNGDLLELPPNEFDGILCRGVLNDFISEASRKAAIQSLARGLRPNGTLIIDVRDWMITAQTKASQPYLAKRLTTERGLLDFSSKTTLDMQRKVLRVKEVHTLTNEVTTESVDYEFTMRCWTLEELMDSFVGAELGPPRLFGGYNLETPLGSTDRIVAIAQKANRPRASKHARKHYGPP